MTQTVDVDEIAGPGFAPEGCAECGTAANTYHYPGCSFAPYVCPGCFAFDGEACAYFCPDAALARQRESEEELGPDDERLDLNDCDDWELEP